MTTLNFETMTDAEVVSYVKETFKVSKKKALVLLGNAQERCDFASDDEDYTTADIIAQVKLIVEASMGQ